MLSRSGTEKSPDTARTHCCPKVRLMNQSSHRYTSMQFNQRVPTCVAVLSNSTAAAAPPLAHHTCCTNQSASNLNSSSGCASTMDCDKGALGNSIALGGPLVRRIITVHGAHERRVDCELALDHHFQSSVVRGKHCQVHIARESVDSDPTSGLPANPRHRALQCKTPAPQNPCPCANCTVMAKDVNGAATPATADGHGEGQPKSPKKDNTEQMRLDRGEAARGRHSQSVTSSRSSLSSSVRDAASCWQPCRTPPGSYSSGGVAHLQRPPAKKAAQNPSHLFAFFWLQQLPADMDLLHLAPEQPQKPLPCNKHESWPTNLPSWPRMRVSLFALRCAVQSLPEPKAWLLRLSSPGSGLNPPAGWRMNKPSS